MPVEVRELVVSFSVEEAKERETPPVLDGVTRRRLVRECVDAVLLALRDKREP